MRAFVLLFSSLALAHIRSKKKETGKWDVRVFYRDLELEPTERPLHRDLELEPTLSSSSAKKETGKWDVRVFYRGLEPGPIERPFCRRLHCRDVGVLDSRAL